MNILEQNLKKILFFCKFPKKFPPRKSRQIFIFLLQLLHNKIKIFFFLSPPCKIYHVDNEEMFILKILDSHWVRTFFALFSIWERRKNRISSFWRVLLLTVKSFLLPQFKNNWLILFWLLQKFSSCYPLVFYLFFLVDDSETVI